MIPGWGSSPGTLPAGSVDNSEQANMAAGTTKLRALGSGTGPPVDGTAAQLRANAGLAQDGVYIVNPGDAAAYQTVQAALDAGNAGALTEYIVQVAVGRTYTENLTVAPGKIAKIRSDSEYIYDTSIAGNITWNGSLGALSLENLYVTGTVGGAATGACSLHSNHCGIDGAVTFTGSAVNVHSNGRYGWNSGFQGYFATTLSTTGAVVLVDTGIFGAVTSTSAVGVVLNRCRLQGTYNITSAGTSIRLASCDVSSGVQTPVFSGSAGTVLADQYTLAQLLAAGATPTNGIWGGRTILTAGAELTIAAGVVTATHSRHAIDTEADGATDDLDTINGTVDGQLLVVYAADSGRTVVLKDGTGNLKLPGDVTLDNVEDVVMLINRGGTLYAIAPVSNSGA